MFKLSENYEIGRGNLKCDFIRYSLGGTSTISTPNCQVYTDMPRKGSIISLINSFFSI